MAKLYNSITSLMSEMRPEPYLKQPKRVSGMGLVSAIALITLAAVLSIAIMRTVRTGSDSSTQALVSFRAFLAAESGAQLAANRLVAPLGSPTCSSQNFDLADVGLPSCSVVVDCRAETVVSEILYTLQSTAICNPSGFSASHSLVVRLSE